MARLVRKYEEARVRGDYDSDADMFQKACDVMELLVENITGEEAKYAGAIKKMMMAMVLTRTCEGEDMKKMVVEIFGSEQVSHTNEDTMTQMGMTNEEEDSDEN